MHIIDKNECKSNKENIKYFCLEGKNAIVWLGGSPHSQRNILLPLHDKYESRNDIFGLSSNYNFMKYKERLGVYSPNNNLDLSIVLITDRDLTGVSQH